MKSTEYPCAPETHTDRDGVVWVRDWRTISPEMQQLQWVKAGSQNGDGPLLPEKAAQS